MNAEAVCRGEPASSNLLQARLGEAVRRAESASRSLLQGEMRSGDALGG
jgi:hypothetical protein